MIKDFPLLHREPKSGSKRSRAVIRRRMLQSLCASLLLLPAVDAIAQEPAAPPAPPREFRGAWVATVHGIDWPYEPGDSAAKQQAEIIAICDKAVALKLNALIFQVRPAGDAMYQSDIEPWSPYFTGGMGKAPEPFWDPLDFFIKEAHARGLELHAWFNPFRALSGKQFSGAGNHISVQHPEWCWRYGDNLWMDPGEPGVRARSLAVILDVVKRYEVDGIHMDDYFYPYPIKGKSGSLDFPDDRSWTAAQTAGTKLTRSEWRRENVNSFVQDLYKGIKKEKPWVRFGISPFGLWRPGFPAGCGKGALDPYEDLAADSLKWLQSGWVDYLAPQLYWPIEPANLSFTKFFDWWLTQNTAMRHVWPGMASDRVLRDRQPYEILKQISYTRSRIDYMPPGHVHWNFSALAKNRGKLADLCAQRAYQDVAIVPPASWLGQEKPAPPQMIVVKDGRATWNLADARLETFVKWWYVQTFEKDKWVGRKLLPAAMKEFTMPKGATGIAVRGIGKTGIAGEPASAGALVTGNRTASSTKSASDTKVVAGAE
jgi:uncharacterized lipoprotein YddW (UPF0748 family)